MLAANGAVAETILKAEKPSLYRIHEDPDPDKLLEFSQLAHDHGLAAGDLTHRPNLQKLLRELRGHAAEPVLKLALLKSLKRAVYHPDCLGHYGLAKARYTHFTSPIRRYTDLVVHRVLKRLLGAKEIQSPSYGEMERLAEHLSKTERTAADAELETKRLKLTAYFVQRAQESPAPTFQVLITEISRMGLFIELLDYGVRGLMRMADLPGEDYYKISRDSQSLSAGKGRHYQVGQQLEATLIRVDKKRGYLDFQPSN